MDGTTCICEQVGRYFPLYAQFSNDRMLVASTCESPMLFQINTLNKNKKAFMEGVFPSCPTSIAWQRRKRLY